MKKSWQEELKTLLKDNRSLSTTGGSGEAYWNSVIKVIEGFVLSKKKKI